MTYDRTQSGLLLRLWGKMSQIKASRGEAKGNRLRQIGRGELTGPKRPICGRNGPMDVFWPNVIKK